MISALGPSPLQRGTPIADGTARIVEAMRRAGVDRLVAIATRAPPTRPTLRGGTDGDGPAPAVHTGPVGADGGGLVLTRAALAAYLVDAATSGRAVGAAPVVSDN